LILAFFSTLSCLEYFKPGPEPEKAFWQSQDAPGCVVPEDPLDFPLKLDGTATELGAELAGECSQALVSHLEADFGDAALGSKQLAGTVQAQASQEIVWCLAESRAEEPMKVEFGKAGLAGGVPQ